MIFLHHTESKPWLKIIAMQLNPGREIISFAATKLQLALPGDWQSNYTGSDAATNARIASCAITSGFISSTSKTSF